MKFPLSLLIDKTPEEIKADEVKTENAQKAVKLAKSKAYVIELVKKIKAQEAAGL